jgi:hypothetical protein
MIETYKGCEEPLLVQTNPIVHQHVPYSSTKFVFGFNYFKERGMKKDRFTCDLDAAALMTQVDRQFMPQAEITITPYMLVNNHGR